MIIPILQMRKQKPSGKRLVQDPEASNLWGAEWRFECRRPFSSHVLACHVIELH